MTYVLIFLLAAAVAVLIDYVGAKMAENRIREIEESVDPVPEGRASDEDKQ